MARRFTLLVVFQPRNGTFAWALCNLCDAAVVRGDDGRRGGDMGGTTETGLARPSVERRWVGVGTAGQMDPAEAGALAANQALRADNPKLLVVFASDALEPKALLDGVASVAPDVPLVGCSTAGEIAGTGPGDAGVVVLALGGSGFSVATALAEAHGDLRAAGESAARCAEEVRDRPHRA